MREVFADTFYWAALMNPGDSAHDRASELSRSMDSVKIVTTDEILTEYLTFFSASRPIVRATAAKNAADLLKKSIS